VKVEESCHGARSLIDSAPNELLTAAGALGPRIRAIQDEIDEARRLPASLVEALSDTGIFEAYYPEAFGGLQVDPMTLCCSVEAISRADGSVGWCAMVGGVFGIVAGWLPAAVAEEMFGRPPDLRLAGSFNSTGVAQRVPGGYRIRGRWTFASGIEYARWIHCPCAVSDSGDPTTSATDSPEMRSMFLPVEEVRVLDTWSVLGMRATGSQDFIVDDCFVPEERSVCLSDPPQAEGVLYDPRYLLPVSRVAVAGVSLGIARGAMDAFHELACKSGTNLSATLLRDRSDVQLAVARAEAILNATRAYLMQAIERAWDALRAGSGDPALEFSHLQLATAHAIHEPVRVVEILFETAGTNSVYRRHGLERALRDVRVAALHVTGHPTNLEAAGRVLLGIRVPH
jgi:alkylation response protein AidB-like acyl-CoA dehydrogenase